jgi:hypothetical protein
MPTDADLDRDVRVAFYTRLIESGTAPSTGDLAAALNVEPAAVFASFQRLGAARTLVLEPGDSARVRMANPFSCIPTPFAVTAAGRQWWGNCIWDSLGIAAFLGSDATIECTCGDCGQPMSVAIRDGQAHGSGVIQFGVPALHWWDDIVYT